MSLPQIGPTAFNAADLVRLKVDAIVTTGTQGVLATKYATKTIPIVMATGSDPVAAGIARSLAQPGGNVTGLTTIGEDLSGKRLALLKETIPTIARVAVLWDPSDSGAAASFKETETMAHALRVRVQSLEVLSPKDFDAAFRAATRDDPAPSPC
jgi:putative ABC transport system substrate-binding protein